MIVSVIVAVYNSERYLPEMLDSVLNQTLKDIEVICVDDGSTDSSLEILHKYASADPRIQIVSIEHSGLGAANARNEGLKYATGEYLSILDSDDVFEPEMLELMVEKARDTKADIVVADAYKYDTETGNTLHCTFFCNTNLTDKDVFDYTDLGDGIFNLTLGAAWNLLLRRDFVRSNGIEFYPVKHADDLFFAYYSFLKAKRITTVKKQLLYYRVNSSSQSGNLNKCIDSPYLAWKYFKDVLEAEGLYSENVQKSLVNKVCEYLVFYMDNITDFGAFKELYNKWKYEHLEEFGIDKFPKQYFNDMNFYAKIQRIISLSAEDYLINTLNFKPNEFYTYGLPAGSRVVIYGAGVAGRIAFDQLFKFDCCQIVSWVDKNADAIGYPVQRIDVINTLDFDYILLAIYNRSICNSVKEFLVSRGVPVSKIVDINEAI